MPELEKDKAKMEEAVKREEIESKFVEKTENRIESVFKEEGLPADEPEVKDKSTPDEPEGDEKPDDEKPDDEKPDDEKPDDEKPGDEKPDDEKPGDEKPVGDQADKSEDDSKSTPEPEAKGIPDAYVRAAIHNGWKEEDVKELYELDSEKALKTFENIYRSTNNLAKNYAELGRATQLKTFEEQKKLESPQKDQPVTGLSKEQLTKLEEEYKDDPILQIIKQQDESNKKLSEKLDEVSQQFSDVVKKATVDKEQEALVNDQILGFFTDKDLTKYYDDFYGIIPKDGDWKSSLTPGQQANRWAVLERADQIRAGAKVQGRDMLVREALDLAHSLVTEPIREQKIREDITASVKKRSKSLSLKPSASQTQQMEGSSPKNEKELVEVVQERLSKLKL